MTFALNVINAQASNKCQINYSNQTEMKSFSLSPVKLISDDNEADVSDGVAKEKRSWNDN